MAEVFNPAVDWAKLVWADPLEWQIYESNPFVRIDAGDCRYCVSMHRRAVGWHWCISDRDTLMLCDGFFNHEAEARKDAWGRVVELVKTGSLDEARQSAL